MLAYTIRRIFISIPILIAASFIIFWLVSLSGNPVTNAYLGRNPPVSPVTIRQETHRLYLDQGFFHQYWTWLYNLVVHGSFGPSINKTENIGHELGIRVMVTFRLILMAMLIALLLAVLSGVLSAIRQYSKLDYSLTFIGFLFLAMPSFWIAVLLKEGGIKFNNSTGKRVFFTIGEQSYPPVTGAWNHFLDISGHMILPTISLALISYAAWSRFQRSSMLEVLDSEYIRLARAKGLTPRRVLVRHALRTALIPMVTVSALGIAFILGGAVITETVFNWQGMGRFLIDSIFAYDRYAVMAWLLVSGFFVIIGNLVADLLYAALDPRIRYE